MAKATWGFGGDINNVSLNSGKKVEPKKAETKKPEPKPSPTKPS